MSSGSVVRSPAPRVRQRSPGSSTWPTARCNSSRPGAYVTGSLGSCALTASATRRPEAPGNGALAGAVDVGDHQHVGVTERGCKIRRQGCSREKRWGWKTATTRSQVPLAGGRQRGPHLAGQVGIVIHIGHAVAGSCGPQTGARRRHNAARASRAASGAAPISKTATARAATALRTLCRPGTGRSNLPRARPRAQTSKWVAPGANSGPVDAVVGPGGHPVRRRPGHGGSQGGGSGIVEADDPGARGLLPERCGTRRPGRPPRRSSRGGRVRRWSPPRPPPPSGGTCRRTRPPRRRATPPSPTPRSSRSR